MPPKFSDEITALFRARPKLRFIKPVKYEPPRPYGGVVKYLREIPKYHFPKETSDPYLDINELRIKRRQQRVAANDAKVALGIKNYHPKENKDATSNPRATMFICNIPENITEEQIKYELKAFGPIKTIKFPIDIVTKKRKNYCFAEYVHESSFKNAMTQGTKLYFNNKKMIVDRERGRTEPGWLPRRLGGGIGAISRRFAQKTIFLEARQCKKRHRFGYKWGKRYRGSMIEESRKKDASIGINRENVRRMRLKSKSISKRVTKY
ncbi:hypothetical protein M9Y10_044629 [Tritrichomonas musculus]|uniref:RRM domain-containing protein n=1 Tax=Tritrichomonas musculus TaxID=1915356 RepID=A0ABR2GLJ3_9EUKA